MGRATNQKNLIMNCEAVCVANDTVQTNTVSTIYYYSNLIPVDIETLLLQISNDTERSNPCSVDPVLESFTFPKSNASVGSTDIVLSKNYSLNKYLFTLKGINDDNRICLNSNPIQIIPKTVSDKSNQQVGEPVFNPTYESKGSISWILLVVFALIFVIIFIFLCIYKRRAAKKMVQSPLLQQIHTASTPTETNNAVEISFETENTRINFKQLENNFNDSHFNLSQTMPSASENNFNTPAVNRVSSISSLSMSSASFYTAENSEVDLCEADIIKEYLDPDLNDINFYVQKESGSESIKSGSSKNTITPIKN
jgi:hypothetical protein